MSVGYEGEFGDADVADLSPDEVSALEQIRNDFVATFGTPSGRRVLTYLARRCHQVESTFVPGDVHATVHATGKRDAYLEILRWVVMDDLELIELSVQEAQRRGA